MSADLKLLEKLIRESLRKDQFRLKRSLDRLRTDLNAGKDVKDSLEALQAKLAESVAAKQKRLLSIPELYYPDDLPVVQKKDEILAAIQKNQVTVICGETGSGKTTQLPKICLEAGRGASGYIGHTQPRRIAARTVASRIAEELKQPLGQSVGYKVRFHDQTQPESLIKLMTDGILLAETQTDRFLDQYDTLIIDEAHERSLNIDFLLGYFKWLLPKRPDFKLIVTSATIDPQRFSKHFNNAPIIEVSGRTYPVEVRYRPVSILEEDETEDAEQLAILDACDELHQESNGDILIFLSGEREIRETAESLRKHHPVDCEILPLYSRLSNAEQEKIFKPHKKRRIVLATNVAETSLTVPGIHAVIDAGYARISRYSHRSKLQRLPIEKISQASANQRAGRCGRVGPGICIRLYSVEDYQSRPEFTEPEILRTHLASVILQMKSLGLGDMSDFPFIEPPDERMVRDGLRTLQEINAVDKQKKLTEIGKNLAKLPVDPKLGRMILAASEQNSLTEVAIIVSALSLQDPRDRPADKQQAADQKHARFKDERSDFMGLLKLWQEFQDKKKHLSNNKLRKYCQENFLSYLRLCEWEDIHKQILQVAKGDLALRFNQADSEYPEIHKPLLCGLLSNIGFKQDQYEYLGARGLKFQIFPGSHLFKARPKWIMAAEQVETSKVYARSVAKIEPEWIEQCGGHLLNRQYYEPRFEKKAGRVGVHERTSLFGLVIQNGRKIPYENVDPTAAREIFIRSGLVEMEYDSKASFFSHNRELLAAADYLQQKGRRVDLVADEEWIYRFYDELIPAEVVNGVTFEVWRKKAEKAKPDLLKMTQEDITREPDRAVSAADFPDELVFGKLKFELEYRFEPGHEDDGVTLIIPLHALNQLPSDPFPWLVPGLFREKILALIKNLPKHTRKHFVPAPEHADKVYPLLNYRVGNLYRCLSDGLKKLTGFNVPLEEWSEEGLSLHLRMNFALVDENRVVLARSRDLFELKRRFTDEAVQNFKELATTELSFTGCTDWCFGDLPEYYQSGLIQGYPSLLDEGQTVGVRVYDSQAEANLSHELGLIRLFQLSMTKELKYLRKNLPLTSVIEFNYSKLPPHPFLYESLKQNRDLRGDLLDRIMAVLFLDEKPEIRSREDFEKRLHDVRGEVVLKGNEVSARAVEILNLYGEVFKLAQAKNNIAAKDVQEQLALLIYSGFILTTPFSALKEIPRYLKAMKHRLEKAPQDPNRDQKQYAEMASIQKKYWESVRQTKTSPERDAFRWSLEELRVSLFAQTLKTAYPVSVKRLEEAWNKRIKGG